MPAAFPFEIRQSTRSHRACLCQAWRREDGTDVMLAVEREIIPNLVITLNLTYQPEWTHFAGATTEERRCSRSGETRLLPAS